MANILERFNNFAVGTSNSDSDFTSKISSKGDFTRIDGLQAILNSWNNILLTPLRSVDHDPEYGCELYKYVFAPQDEVTRDLIKQEVYQRLFYYDDRAKIQDVQVGYLKDKKGFYLHIFINYQGKKEKLQLFIDENKYFNAVQS